MCEGFWPVGARAGLLLTMRRVQGGRHMRGGQRQRPGQTRGGQERAGGDYVIRGGLRLLGQWSVMVTHYL